MRRKFLFIGCMFVMLAGCGQFAHSQEDALYALKVRYAKSIGLDTLPEIRAQMDVSRRAALVSALTGNAFEEQTASLKNRLGMKDEQVRFQQIFMHTPQNISRTNLRLVEQRMDSIYERLLQGVPFDEMVSRFSEQKDEQVIGRSQVPVEIEEKAFALNVGELSIPFLSPMGIHIIKVLEKTSVVDTSQALTIRLQGLESRNTSLASVIETLKSACHFEKNEENCKDLVRRGVSDKVLFSIDGHEYTGAQFARFYLANYGEISSQLENYICKALLDYRANQLSSEIDAQVVHSVDDLLVAEATRREVILPSEEEAAQRAYFQTHRDEFNWEMERYKGIVIKAVSKKVLKQARKAIKKAAYEDWEPLLTQMFNAEGRPQVEVAQGIFALGDNTDVDALVYKVTQAPVSADFPYMEVQGKKLKGPETFETTPREKVVERLQSYLENQWLKKLNAL